ncbi:YdaS family helix-turn-helix protein [Halomonas sp. hl-4]|uniref:YdaS family helix-turn-helix protein n=1 Tax=Halomonas sp. hl-4 TaxID=1761789 RepID=UPI000BB695FE|nr:YdaS family helix-turn-helix protein [Halomonas sp. hl-4]SNY95552.1 regulatory protein, Fis family [Halomonas sp. hl-4]
MIDALTHHDPASAPDLIEQAIAVAGSQKELAERLGVTPRTLRQLVRIERDMSYTMQVALEQIIKSP